MPTHFAVLGAGAWGTTVALLLAEKPGHSVALWGPRAESVRELVQRRENVRLLPGVVIPEGVQITADVGDAVAGADLIVCAVPTVYLRGCLEQVAARLPRGVPLLSLAKGIERKTFLRPSEILLELAGPRSVAVLSGPSHAEEVSRGLPASVVVAAEDLSLARRVQDQFAGDRFRVYTNLDVLGVELAGALKNILGIAAGVCEGLRLGDNARAALITRGLAEITRFGVALGAEAQTFAGLAGVGDLITTCVSPHGRNREVGLRLAAGERLPGISASTGKVAEGVYTAESVHGLSARMGIPMPITSAVYRVLYEGKDPLDAVQELMVRAPKSETV